jgi:hypothetical protein
MKEYITIKESTYGKSVTNGAKISMEQNEVQKANTEEGFKEIPFNIIMGHELAHAESNIKAVSSSFAFKDWTSIDTPAGEKTLSTAEIYASHIENILRKEGKYPLRTHYSPDQDGNPVLGTQLIHNGKSLHFRSGITDFKETSKKHIKKDDRYLY